MLPLIDEEYERKMQEEQILSEIEKRQYELMNDLINVGDFPDVLLGDIKKILGWEK